VSCSNSAKAPSAQATATLLAEIRACRLCRETPRGRPLPHEPRPILRLLPGGAPLLICSQAPGTRAHASGMPFTDPSGVRLRFWLGLSEAEFYDQRLVGIVPMGFCFPGQTANGADLPPRQECAATWHDRVFDALAPPALLCAVGLYAIRYHLIRLGHGNLAQGSLGDCLERWRETLALARVIPLPHPSWRNTAWLKRHPWFEAQIVPILRDEVQRAIRPDMSSQSLCPESRHETV
jgi:uracil-DNA glycosylase